MNIITEWNKLPAIVRDQLPDNLPAAFGSALAQLAALGLAVDAERSASALLTAVAREIVNARVEMRAVSRSEADWMRKPLFVVGRDAPADFLRLRNSRHAEIRNSQPLVAYKIAAIERTGGGMEAHQADADLGAAVDNALSAQPATRPESPATLAARIAPVVFAQLGFTPPPPRRKRPLPKQTKPDPKPPTPEQPTPEQPATPAGLPAWVLPAAAAVALVLLIAQRNR